MEKLRMWRKDFSFKADLSEVERKEKSFHWIIGYNVYQHETAREMIAKVTKHKSVKIDR